MSEHFIEDTNLSVAWGRALKASSQKGRSEVVPLVVSITGFDANNDFSEDHQIRSALDSFLASEGKQAVETVAGTIFPFFLWNQNQPRSLLFDRYTRILPRLRKASTKNRHGIYFERMVAGGPEAHPNQLEFLISEFLSRPGVRRSMLQVGIFNPALDHSASAQRGFPCLQHVTFAPVGDTLSVNAFYATQYLVERAYGNYMGICRLGKFVAHELNLKLARVTCYTGIAECDSVKGKLASILAHVPME